MSETPTLDALAESESRRDAVLDFLQWLSEEPDHAKHIHLARCNQYCRLCDLRTAPEPPTLRVCGRQRSAREPS